MQTNVKAMEPDAMAKIRDLETFLETSAKVKAMEPGAMGKIKDLEKILDLLTKMKAREPEEAARELAA